MTGYGRYPVNVTSAPSAAASASKSSRSGPSPSSMTRTLSAPRRLRTSAARMSVGIS